MKDKWNRAAVEITNDIFSNLIFINMRLSKHKAKARCICGCGRRFTQRTKYHHFYSRSCYNKTHRIKGFIRRIVNHED